jgi:hypothetical protein
MAKDLRGGPDEDVVPLISDLNAGESYGLEFPIICGWRPDRHMWMAWNRHTGEVIAFASYQPTVMGWCDGKYLVRKIAAKQAEHVPFNPYNLDGIS